MKNKLLQSVMFLFVCFGLTSLTSAETVPVEAGTDVISGALVDAMAGDIIELTTSGGVYSEAAGIVIPVDITIRAAEGLA